MDKNENVTVLPTTPRGILRPLTMGAVIKRINRRLAAEQEKLKATRGDRWRGELGDYYVLDLNRNLIDQKNVDPEQLGRELGVLQRWETVAQ